MDGLEMPKKSKKPDQWEIDSWVDTIVKAEEIKADPAKMKLVKPALEKRFGGIKKAVSSISDLKSIRNEKAMQEMDSGEEE